MMLQSRCNQELQPLEGLMWLEELLPIWITYMAVSRGPHFPMWVSSLQRTAWVPSWHDRWLSPEQVMRKRKAGVTVSFGTSLRCHILSLPQYPNCYTDQPYSLWDISLYILGGKNHWGTALTVFFLIFIFIIFETRSRCIVQSIVQWCNHSSL